MGRQRQQPGLDEVRKQSSDHSVTYSISKIKMFETVPTQPPDSIFGLTEAFKADPREEKVNLSVGVYQDENGVTPIMKCVHEAETQLLKECQSKSYLPIDGLPGYCQQIANLILGDELFGRNDVCYATAQTPGGTAALRVAAELMKRVFEVPAIWISNPTWANHRQIFSSVGLNILEYDYLDVQGTGLNFSGMMDSLKDIEKGSGILLHTVCHNPSGVDLGLEDWQQLFEFIRQRELLAVFDFAYQGFGSDIHSDAAPIRRFCGAGGEAIVCNSFSKNFGLYGERVGGITAVSHSSDASAAMLSQIKSTIRTLYSNPPMHGAQIVNTVLSSPELRQTWETELAEMRERIIRLRGEFVERIDKLIPADDFSYINRQRGMFSYSGLTREQVDRLRENHAIYALRTGRINVAGLNQGNIERICQAIAVVV